jgi:hypothetical protein
MNKKNCRRIRKIICTMVLVCMGSLPAFAVSAISDLSGNGDRSVTVIAEAIGNPIKTQRGVWFNLFDGKDYISVWAKDPKQLEVITFWGSFKSNGDLVRLEGVFNELCQEHHIADIHLERLTIQAKGGLRPDFVSSRKRLYADIVIVICLTIVLVYFIKVRGRNRPAKSRS